MERLKNGGLRKIILGGIILLLLLCISLFFLIPKNLIAVEIRLQRLVGIVNMYDDRGKEISLIEKMRLNSGNRVTTGDESLVSMSLDDTKIVTVEEDSEIQIKSSGKKLELDINEGNVYINVTEKLDSDQAFDIRSGNMVCGIRGTSLFQGTDSEGHQMAMATDGMLGVTAVDETTGDVISADCGPGEMITLYTGKEAEEGKNISFKMREYREEDLPPLALDSIRKDPELQDRVQESTGLSIEKIIALAEVTSKEGQSMYGAAAGELQTYGIEDAIPLMGSEAWNMVSTANEAADVSEDDFDLEIEIIKEIKEVQDTGKENDVRGEELTALVKDSTSCVIASVKLAKEKGMESTDLRAIVKSVAGTLTAAVSELESSDLSSDEVLQVINSISKVYTDAIEIAAAGAAENGDNTGDLVVGAVENASGFIQDTVVSEMEKSASGEETSDALLNLTDNTQEDESAEQANNTLILPDGNGDGQDLLVENRDPNAAVGDGQQNAGDGAGNSGEGNSTGGNASGASAGQGTSGTGSNNGSGSGNGSSDNGSGSGSDSGNASGSGGSTSSEPHNVAISSISGGSVTASVNGAESSTALEGQTVTLTFAPATGHKLSRVEVMTKSGTLINVSESGNVASFTMPAEEVNVSADFAAETYAVNLITDDTVTISDTSVTSYTYGVGAILPSSVTKTPTAEQTFSFDGWYTESQGGSKVAQIGTQATGEKTYYARFTSEVRKYAINISSDANGDAVARLSGEIVQEAPIGASISVMAVPNEGCSFDKWTDLGGNAGLEGELTASTISFTMPVGDVSIEAGFKWIYHTISASSVSGGRVLSSPQSAHLGENVTLSIEPITGYELDTISVTSGGTAVTLSGSADTRTFTMPNADVRVDAAFKLKTLSISGETSDHITGLDVAVGGTSGQTTARMGDSVSFSMTLEEEYEIDSILVTTESGSAISPTSQSGSSVPTYSFEMPGENVTINVQAKKITYAISFASSMDHGRVQAHLQGSSETIERASKGDTVVLDIIPDTNYWLLSLEVRRAQGSGLVSSAGEMAETLSFTMPGEAVNISGSFEKQYYSFSWSRLSTQDLPIENIHASVVGGNTLSDGDTVTVESEIRMTFDRPDGKVISSVNMEDSAHNSLGSADSLSLDTSSWTTYTAVLTMPAAATYVTASETSNMFAITKTSEHGTTQALDTAAAADSRVSFTVIPEAWYQVDTVTMTPQGGSAQQINFVDEAYSFTMPPVPVTVAINYKHVTAGLFNQDRTVIMSWDDMTSGSDPIITVNNGRYEIASGKQSYMQGVFIADTSVTSFGTFDSCSNLTEIILPNVTEIGSNDSVSCKFTNCNNLQRVEAPALQQVTNYMFAHTSLSNLKEVEFGSGLTSIGLSAFASRTSLLGITIPDNVTTIGGHAFEGCTGLQTLSIGSKVSSIGDQAFSGCSGLSSLAIPDSVTSVGTSAFYNCTGLTEATIGDGLVTLPSYMFQNCENLATVTIGLGTTTISGYAFQNCYNLEGVTVGNGLTTIADNAFADNSSQVKMLNSFYFKSSSYRWLNAVSVGSDGNAKLLDSSVLIKLDYYLVDAVSQDLRTYLSYSTANESDVDHGCFKTGATVNVTVTPPDGCKIKTLSYYVDDQTISVPVVEDQLVYSFTMPEGYVHFNVTFEDI